MNSSRISNCQHSKSAIFASRNINSNINSWLWLCVETHYIYRALHTGSRNENNKSMHVTVNYKYALQLQTSQ